MIGIRTDPLCISDQVQEFGGSYIPRCFIRISIVTVNIFIDMRQGNDAVSCRLRQPGSKVPMGRIISQKIAEDVAALRKRSVLPQSVPLLCSEQKCGVRDNRYFPPAELSHQLLPRPLAHTDVADGRQESGGSLSDLAGKVGLTEAGRIGDRIDPLRDKTECIIIRRYIGRQPELVTSDQDRAVLFRTRSRQFPA